MNTHEHICIGMHLYHHLLKWGWNKVGCFVNWTEMHLYKIKGNGVLSHFIYFNVCWGRCNAAVRLESLFTPASQQACHSTYWWYTWKEGSTKIGSVHKSGKNSTYQTFLHRRNCAYPVCAVAQNKPIYHDVTQKT